MGKQAPAATSREIQLEIYYLHLALSRAPGELAQLAGLLDGNPLAAGTTALPLIACNLILMYWLVFR